MQHFLLQARLLWLFFPAIAMAIQIITPGSTPAGGDSSPQSGSLSLVSPNFMSNNINDRPRLCKDPNDPDPFINSLNRTLPPTPPLPSPDYPPGESEVFALDCYIEVIHGWLGFEIKGEIGSDLSFVFQAWADVWYFRFDIGIFRCSLQDLDKDPCVFSINTKYLVGQAGIFPKLDADPDKIHLCFKLKATFHLPYKRAKNINFEECFITFTKPDDIAADALSPEPVLSNPNATIV